MVRGDVYFMREALKQAELSLKSGDWPIGCVIVLDGRIIAEGRNQVYSLESRIAHAEMSALNKVKDVLFKRKGEASLYTTYEPCPMCLGAILLHRVHFLASGTNPDMSGALDMIPHLPEAFMNKEYRLEVKRGLLAKECYELFMRGIPTKKLIEQGRIREQHYF